MKKSLLIFNPVVLAITTTYPQMPEDRLEELGIPHPEAKKPLLNMPLLLAGLLTPSDNHLAATISRILPK